MACESSMLATLCSLLGRLRRRLPTGNDATTGRRSTALAAIIVGVQEGALPVPGAFVAADAHAAVGLAAAAPRCEVVALGELMLEPPDVGVLGRQFDLFRLAVEDVVDGVLGLLHGAGRGAAAIHGV